MYIIAKDEKYGVGTKHITNEGYEIEIIEKMRQGKRRVRFKNGYEIICERTNIGAGHVRNPYHHSVYGVGHLGVGDYKSKAKGRITAEYEVWNKMLQRCYSEKYQKRQPTYIGTAVCDEWLNYQNFAEWYNNNFKKIEDIKFEIDKDLLQVGIENKIYSPQTCIFLPKKINSFLTNNKRYNSTGHTGVYWIETRKKWQSKINIFGEENRKTLGIFNTIDEASKSYQSARVVEVEKVKEYLRSLNYLSEEIIQLVK